MDYQISVRHHLEGGREVEVGRLDIYHFNAVRAWREVGVPELHEAFDQLSDLDACLRLVSGRSHVCNVMIIDRMEFLPQLRGRGLGIGVLDHAIGCLAALPCRIALDPIPAQHRQRPSLDRWEDSDDWSRRMDLSSLEKCPNLAYDHLRIYYGLVAGFQPLEGSKFIFIDDI